MFSNVLILAAALLVLVSYSEAENNETIGNRYRNFQLPEGHPENCKFLTENNGAGMRVLGVLPGVGWDNLRNVFMGMVMKYEYKQCRLTEDKDYLLPDGMYTIPIKQSKVDTSVQVFRHWSEYKSAKSASINADASYSKIVASVSGSFSLELQKNKIRQSKKGMMTTRVQLRHRLYNVVMGSGTAFTKEFKARLMKIGTNLADGDDVMAAYHSDEIVRDYGTHILTKVEAGAVILHESQIDNAESDTSDAYMVGVKSSATASFLGGRFKVSVSAGGEVTEKTSGKVKIDTVDNQIKSYGGPLLTSSMSISDWEDGIHNHLVAIDESGEPLHAVVTSGYIGDMPAFLVRRVAVEIKNAVYRYYEMNTIRGCLNSESENFNFLANTNQTDLCDPPEESEYEVGGAYTTCSPRVGLPQSEICKRVSKHNPFTGSDECPAGFVQYTISTETRSKPYYVQKKEKECVKKKFRVRKSCMYVTTLERKMDSAEIESVWCGRRNNGNAMYYFGGIYALPNVPNPVTKSTICPEYFITLSLGYGVRICVSKDKRANKLLTSIKFGGVFTCKVSNPFATNESTKYDRDDETLQKCPEGFSSYTAIIMDSTCLFSYCLRSVTNNANTIGTEIQLPIRPPYADPPEPSANLTNTMAFMEYSTGEMWMKNRSTDGWSKYAFGDEPPPDSLGFVDDSYASVAVTNHQLPTLAYVITLSLLFTWTAAF